MLEFFVSRRVDYVLIGGVAMHTYGLGRATQDVDFAVNGADQEMIIGHLEAIGFTTVQRSSGFSNHAHELDGVRVDFLYVTGPTAAELFANAQVTSDLHMPAVRVASAEHMVAMKVFACRNDPSRKLRDLADIRELIVRGYLHRDAARLYFERYGQMALWPLVAAGKQPTDA